jgi:hypothetical protein
MTPLQITKALIAGGVSENDIENHINISRDEVEVYVGGNGLKPASFDSFEATEELSTKVGEVLGWGGFKCGYGGWVLQNGYRANTQDYCDQSNPIHY